MAQIMLEQSDLEYSSLRELGARQQTSVAELLHWYVEYLIAGGEPLAHAAEEAPNAAELARLAQYRGAFAWLAAEPDLYSDADGVPA